MKNFVKRLLSAPVRRVIDPPVRNVIDHVNIRVDGVEFKIHDLDALLREIEMQLRQAEQALTTDVQTAAEFAATFRRSTERIEELFRHVEERNRRIEGAMVRALGLLGSTAEPDYTLAELDAGAAQLLNWAESHRGFAAQANLWFNPPVSLEYGEGEVRVGDTTERIVEVPYALASVAALPPGARLLDFGAAESTVALSLASLGYDVTALDLRPYPFEHPRLTAVAGRVEEWEGPAEPFDAVLCISTLEHIGLGAYGEEPAAAGAPAADREVLARLGGWLAPGGVLVFTAPFGRWEVGDTQRVYDDEHLDALFEGWKVTDRHVCVRTAADRWERIADDGTVPDESRAVVLLRATPS